ncbi:GGDEF domain-containing protein [Roseateles sp. LKC17W]|uniref:diguanylate cyclase n=1 Tax=Pelomonas margarita TaxID=3299031 RepID=A0ABW7FIA9_9BURK
MLTGAGNRRFLERWFRDVAPQLEAAGSPLAFVMIDVDHFRRVNDVHGHAAGDAVLVALAQLAMHHIRQGDAFARLGGEEFVIVLPDTTPAHAAQFCERLRGQIEALRIALPGGGELSVTISQGIAFAPPYELSDLTARADAAMYAAKRGGRNRVSADDGAQPSGPTGA